MRKQHPIQEPFDVRFWKYVKKDGPVMRPELGPCWLWTGSLDKNGRGQLRKGRAAEGSIQSPRASWIVHHRLIPSRLFVLHHCDNPTCVNPGHLYTGTQKDNGRDVKVRHRSAMLGQGEKVAGESNPNSVLTWGIVDEIRAAHKAGESGASLGKRHCVSKEQIYHIIHGRCWHESSRPVLQSAS